MTKSFVQSAPAASFGNPDEPPQGAINTHGSPASVSDPIRNTGDTDLVFLEVFRSSYFADISLSDWLTHTPPALVAQHFNMDPAVIARFPRNKPLVVPV
jgi:hypothetical protein